MNLQQVDKNTLIEHPIHIHIGNKCKEVNQFKNRLQQDTIIHMLLQMIKSTILEANIPLKGISRHYLRQKRISSIQ